MDKLTTCNKDRNKQIVAEWLDIAYNRPSEIATCNNLISKDHELTADGAKMSWQFLHLQYSNINAKILDQIAEEDKVFTRIRAEGIDRGGNHNQWEAFFFHMIEDGAIKVGQSGITSHMP